MVSALIIPADLRKPMYSVDMEAETEPLQKLVGGYIEVVNLPQASLFINEEGKIHDLDHNPRASALANSHGALFADDNIVGDAILLGWDRDTDTYSDSPKDMLLFLMSLPV